MFNLSVHMFVLILIKQVKNYVLVKAYNQRKKMNMDSITSLV